MRSIVCIGDSIRMGYMPAVEKVLEGWGKVLGIGEVQGGNTRNVLDHLDQWAIRPAPDIVYLNAGLHDMARDPGPGPENRVPLSEYSICGGSSPACAGKRRRGCSSPSPLRWIWRASTQSTTPATAPSTT